MTQFVTQREFHALAKSGRAGGVGVVQAAATVRGLPSAGSRIIPWKLSDGSIDTMFDRVFPDGWDLRDTRNVPLLFSHLASMPPIGTMLNLRTSVSPSALLGDAKVAEPEVYDFADTIFKLICGGYLKAGSVGFVPGVYKFSDDKSRRGGIDFISGHKLVEFSIVNCPANSNALIEARSRGIDIRPLQRWASLAPSMRAPQTVEERRREAREMVREVRLDLARRAFLESKNEADLRHARYLRDLALGT